MGIDDFRIGAEPYIAVNARLGDDHSAAEEIECVTGSIVLPKPELGGRLESRIVLLVSTDDQRSLMSLSNSYNRVWFKLD